MQITLNLPAKYTHYNREVLEEKLNQNIDQVLFELELLEDLKEAQLANKSQFQNL